MRLEKIIKDISTGKRAQSADILPFLCSESKEERCKINAKIADAFLQVNDFRQAKNFIQRAWILSGFASELLPLYMKIHSTTDDIDSIQKAYKQIGMKRASEGNISKALEYFRSSMYAYAEHSQIDKYVYDFDMLETIKVLARPHQFEPRFRIGIMQGRKIRLAYLVFGMLHTNSVIVKINRMFAKFHDKSLFDISFFIPEQKHKIMRSKEARYNIRILEDCNCKVVLPNSKNEEKRLFEVATQIYNYQPDILITNALLADFKHYFIVSLRPSPVVIGFSQGPPPQFVSPDLDWSISWTKHPLIDCLCGCSQVNLEVDLPEKGSISFLKRQDLDIPEDSLIIMGAGRHTKFQDTGYWEAIMDILQQFPNVYYVVVGAERKKIAFLYKFNKPDLLKRVIFFGWQKDFNKILGLADILIDTYPSGGGVVLLDAMALSIPVVTFRNNYLKIFDQVDWSPGEEFISISDLLVERGNFEQFNKIMTKLIEDKIFRLMIAEKCRELVHRNFGNPGRMVKHCENIYTSMIERKLNGTDQLSCAKIINDRYSVWNIKGILRILLRLPKIVLKKAVLAMRLNC